jgi:FkbM family methyltransferase
VRSETEILVLALARELTTEPQLLLDWRKNIGDAAVRLLVYPDEANTPPDSGLATALVGSVSDPRPGLRATVLAGPLSEEQHRTLLRDCAGFYGSAEIPPAVRGLGRLRIDDLAALLSPSRRDYEVTLIGDGYRMHHRESVADRGVLVQVFQLQEYSFEPLSPWLTGPNADTMSDSGQSRLIVDCGANIGASVVYFAKMFPDARIVALEPEPGNFSLLVQNAAPFGGRIAAWDKAIASMPGTVRLTDPGLGEWGYRAGASADGQLLAEVAAVTIDDVLDSAPETTPFVLKVDIEGAEADLFASRGATFDLFRVVIVELHDWMYPGTRISASFLEWHEQHGREMRAAGENFFSLSTALTS